MAVLLAWVAVALGGCATKGRPAGAGAALPVAAAVGGTAAAAPLRVVPWTGQVPAAWREIDRLQDQQQLEQASRRLEARLAQARARGDGEDQTRALIRWTQLRVALHGYETAVRWLREQRWPDDLLSQTALNLYYAGALRSYAQSYAWEIGQRERVDTRGRVDLKAWTMEQLYAEAHRACAAAFGQREALGRVPTVQLAELITPNTYPAGVRPTLRDALTYLWVELLADTQGWRPEQQNALFQLDLGALLGTPPLAAGALADPAVHPLLRVAALLDELERWHGGRRERAAALEARLERLRRLHAAFTEPSDRARLRQDLARRLPALRGSGWWSMGMAELAEMTRDEDAPDSLLRARRLAEEGQRADPAGPGGRRCLAIARAITAPAFTLTAMSHDLPGRRSIGVQHRNLPALHFRAYALELRQQLAAKRDFGLFPEGEALTALLQRPPTQRWTVALPPTPDHRSHWTYLIPPLMRRGYYVVTASARADYARTNNVILATHVMLSGLALVTQQDREGLEVTAVSGEQGRPLAGVRVSLFRRDWQAGHHATLERRTDAQGRVRLPLREGASDFVLAQHGDDLALDPTSLSAWGRARAGEATAALIFTDRSIYRPQQQLQWKVVAYRGRAELGRLRVAPKSRVTVTLRDANGEQVEQREVTTNAYGTAAGAFSLPAGKLLGTWSLTSSPAGAAEIRVEAYKRPTFEVALEAPARALRLNQPATLAGRARYYFGLPVTQGGVRWRVRRVPVYPWWWGFGWRTVAPAAEQVIATGTTTLDAAGRFALRFVPRVDERLRDQRALSYRYSVTAEVTNEGGETGAAERAFRLGFVALEAALRDEPGFLRAGQAAALTIARHDLDGTPAPGHGRYRLLALQQPKQTLAPAEWPVDPAPAGARPDANFATAGDGLRPRWAPGYAPEAALRALADGPEQARGELRHDARGEARLALPALAAGAYRLRYETTDAFGGRCELVRELVVGSAATPLALPALLLVEQGSVQVGGSARLLALSGRAGQTLVLDRFRDGRRLDRRLLVGGTSPTLIELPVTEQDRGGFALTLWTVIDQQYVELARSVLVPWDNKELAVSFATFRDRLRPGSQERWTVQVKGPRGHDAAVGAAELLAYMYDRSLDAFAPHQPPSIAALYPSRAWPGTTRATLGAAASSWVPHEGFDSLPDAPLLQGDALKLPSGYGVGGPGVRLGARGMRLQMMDGGAAREKHSAETQRALARDAPPAASPVASTVAGSLDKTEAKAGTPAQATPQARGGDPAPAPVALRSDFSETAFFLPQLLTDAQGQATIAFTVPDSVTSWQVWVHALTRELSGGSLNRTTQSIKELMVRPYLPRFLREGDRAELELVINSASEQKLDGTAELDIVDPATGRSLRADFGLPGAQARQPFSVAPHASSRLRFALTAPARLDQVAFKVVARAGSFSDGELRPLPILPGRMHLAQSRFVTLRDRGRRELYFADLARADDPTRLNEQLVVTLDAQLFYGVLAALPYLVRYPYECTEQTVNRFVSTGILASLYGHFPAVGRMAQQLAARPTQLERWDAPDPNRKLALEETPWLQLARGGALPQDELLNVLDPRIAEAQRQLALAQLSRSQTASGGFPWFPGGPPSPWMTLYLVSSFAKAREFGVALPAALLQRAWAYLHQHYLEEWVGTCMARDACWESVTFLNYTLSSYRDATLGAEVFSAEERQRMLDFSYRHWREHSPYLKGYLALTLHRAGRRAEAQQVWASVMDSAKSAPDQGTFWAPEDRSWLWYNDTIETHAFAIRTLLELAPKDPRLEGLVLWLLLNKQLNHWKSTRATAEAIYALAHYFKQSGQLGQAEAAQVTIGARTQRFDFPAERYTGGGNQLVVPGAQLDAKTMARVQVTQEGRGMMLATATWHFSTERLPQQERGDLLAVSRRYFRRDSQGREATLKPLGPGAQLSVGDEVEVQLSLRAKHPLEYVHLRDPRAAGLEPVSSVSQHRWELGLCWYEELRDSGTNFFFEALPQGEYTFKYRLRVATAGTFRVGPATVQPLYAPEHAAYSTGAVLRVAAR